MAIDPGGARGAPFLFFPSSRPVPATLVLLAALPWAGLPNPARAQVPAPTPGPDTVSTRPPPLHPDTVFRIPGGPRVILLETPGSQLVSIRLLVPLTEGPAEAGSARVLQRLRLDAVRSLARQVGARVDGSRTHRGLAYAVSGTGADFDYLAWLVRRAVADPRADGAAVDREVEAVRAEAARAGETAEGRLRARLRRGVWPGAPPSTGTPGTLDRVNPASLRDFWRRTHDPGRMELVVAGDVEPVLILAAFQAMEPTSGPDGRPLDAPALPHRDEADPEILRTWYGQAFVVTDGSDPRPAVAAALLAQSLEAAPVRLEGAVELWEAGAVSALIVMGAAYPEDAEAMRQTIRQLPATTVRMLDEAHFRETVARVRGDLLFGARTPWGLTSLVGHFVEGTGDPLGAERFLAELESLEPEEMRSFLGELQARTPVREELRP